MYSKNLVKLTFFIIIIVFFNSCSGIKKIPKIDQPVNAKDRVKKNIEEGRGLKMTTSLTNNNSGTGGNFSFASSNPLWRATLEKLDFIPLANVDYAGGVIITDWYGDTNADEQIKVAVRFLTNEVRSDALNIIVYKKICNDLNSCKTQKIANNTGDEIKISILKRAAELLKESESKNE